MELFSLNENVRNILLNYIDKSFLQGITIDDSINAFSSELYEYEDSLNETIREYRSYIISVLYLDALKYVLYRIKVCLTNDDIQKIYSRLNSIDGLDDLLSEISTDPDFFNRIVKEAYNFCSLDFISKSIIFKSLSDVQNCALLDIMPSHFFDIINYSKKIDKEDIVSYMSKMYNYQSMYFEEVASDSIITSIMGYVQMLKICDGGNYKSLLLEIGIIDYYVSSYLSDKISDNDEMLDHVDYYENYSLRDIRKRMSSDQEFLIKAIEMIYSLYIEGQYEDITLKKDILYRDKKMNKKLFFNKKRDDF